MKTKAKFIISFRNVISKLIMHFAIVFSMFAIIDIFVGSLIGNGVGGIFNWMILLIFSIVLSVVLYFIFKLNKISLLFQIIFAYLVIMIGVYAQGYMIRLFTFYDVRFFIICFLISLVGLFILSLVLLLKNKKENDNLNKYLNNFKERDRK